MARFKDEIDAQGVSVGFVHTQIPYNSLGRR